MSAIQEILKMIKDGKTIETEEGEQLRYRITIKNGKLEATVDVVPDLDALTLDQLYALQEEYESRIDEMRDAEPDEEQNPDEYESWEEALDQLEQDLSEVEDKIEEREEDEADEDSDEDE